MFSDRSHNSRVHAKVAAVLGAALLLVFSVLAGTVPAGAASAKVAVQDYSQCQNGAPPDTGLDCNNWGNGILNTGNSHYAEDEVTPQRLLLKVPKGSGASHTVTIEYQTRKGGAADGAHAYDSLATWNYTAKSADRCQGLSTTICPQTGPDTLPMSSDPTVVPPVGAGIDPKTSAHELPAADRLWTAYGADLTSTTVPVHSNATGTNDDYAKVNVTFAVANPQVDTYVQLLFGGHLAPGAKTRSWGADHSAGTISGGPYHLKTAAIDGASAGNRDNQIMSDAVIPLTPAALTVEKVADQASAAPGETVGYTVSVTNSGETEGSTTVVDDYPENHVTVSNISDGGTASGGMINWGTVTVAAGATETFTYDAFINDTAGTTGGSGCDNTQVPVINIVTITGGSDTATVCKQLSPALNVTKMASVETAKPGDIILYTVTVTNSGPIAGSTTVEDDYPEGHVSVSGISDGGTASGGKINWGAVSVPAGGSKSFTYNATVNAEAGTTGGQCSDTQVAMVNTVTIPNGSTDDDVVCKQLEAKLSVEKSVSVPNAQIGDTVTYKVTVSNTGQIAGETPVVDNYDEDHLTLSNIEGEPTDDGDTLDWGLVTVLPGEPVTFTYDATVEGPFAGATGGNDCPVYAVLNLVTIDDDTAEAVLCVDASPELTIKKSADAEGVTTDDQITYTLEYTNSGDAEATGVVVSETVPDGTAFVSCTRSCVVSGTSVTWNLGDVAAGTSDNMSMTVDVTTGQSCSICNTATISAANFNGGTPLASNQVCVGVTHLPNPDTAKANGSAIGLQVLASGLASVKTTPISKAASSQTGAGTSADDETLLSIKVPNNGSIATTGVLTTSSISRVSEDRAEATQTSTATVNNLCVLKVLLVCTVEAKTAQAVASTVANGEYASYSSAGSTIEGLKVAGVAVDVNLNQTTKIPLDALIFGPDSYVAINERSGSVTTPDGAFGGRYGADQTTTMIHVKVTGILGGIQAAEVIVSKATAHSSFDQVVICTDQPGQKVSGHAFVASADLNPDLVGLMQGFVGIAPTGGDESQQIASLSLPASGSIVDADAADSRSQGTNGATSSDATSHAQVAGGPLCVVHLVAQECAVWAQLIRTHVTAHADANGAYASDGFATYAGTQFVGLKVGTIPVGPYPDPNTTIQLPGLGYVVINEQFCDNGTSKSTWGDGCAGDTSSGLTIRGIHLVVTVGSMAGLEVIVSESHADATFAG